MTELGGRELILRACRGEWTPRPPVWLMRQAGRYLPEYRDIRAEYSFLEAHQTPAVAAEIALQPYERFRPDGVIIYSDILTVLEPLGFSYHVESGVGPVVENPVEGPQDVRRRRGSVPDELGYVGDLVDRLDHRLDDAAIVGFAGGPFTLAAYAVEGGSSRSKMRLRRLRSAHPEAFRELLASFADVVGEYLTLQVEHGADVVQLFDTHAACLAPQDYRSFLLPLHREILASVDVPTVVFVRNAGGTLDLLADSGADVVGLDWTTDIGRARDRLGDRPVQGNLDPADLFGGPAHVRDRTRTVIESAGPRGHVLNLGHGVHKQTPIEGVEAFVETAKGWSWD
jgi:uroporphyrinogen decarboxylase